MTSSVFIYNAPSTTEIYTLSLHDALPIFLAQGIECVMNVLARARSCGWWPEAEVRASRPPWRPTSANLGFGPDRKSTRLNSSHVSISYAVFCLKKKNIQ